MAFLQAYDYPSYAATGPAQIQMIIHISCTWLWIHRACVNFQCGTAAERELETGDNSGGRWCGFPNFLYSASQVPSDASCGS